MYSYTADKILNEADLLNKTLNYNERVLLICEGLILHYKKTGEATLDALEFYPGNLYTVLCVYSVSCNIYVLFTFFCIVYVLFLF